MINFTMFEGENHERETFYDYMNGLPLDGWVLENLGVSEDENYDIYGCYLKSNVDGKPYIFLRSSVHGNEWESAYWCRYFSEFLGNPLKAPADIQHFFVHLKNNYNWYWIPIHNPYGYENNTRLNSNGINLNDDLGDLSQIENVYMVNKLQEYKPIVAVDAHSWDHPSTPCHAMSIYREGQYDRTITQELLFRALNNTQFITQEKVSHYTSSGHDPTKFRSWLARQTSTSGLNTMVWLQETERLESVEKQIKQGFNSLLIFILYSDIWFRKGIQNPKNSDFY